VALADEIATTSLPPGSQAKLEYPPAPLVIRRGCAGTFPNPAIHTSFSMVCWFARMIFPSAVTDCETYSPASCVMR
jgi:hypothetical protein